MEKALLIIVAALAAVYALLVWRASKKRPLELWHRALPGEFSVADYRDDASFADYLAIESQLFARLDRLFAESGAEDQKLFNRYHATSVANPGAYTFGLPDGCTNWNRSYELQPAGSVGGGVLLIHGLTDSPYSMRSIGELLRDQGLYVLCLRVPGHGTTPGALGTITKDDWIAAVKVAARHVSETIGSDLPFYVGGYSNGGALVLNYVLDSLSTGATRLPERVFLFSPEIGIHPTAAITNWHKAYSFLPLLERNKWLEIEAEFDPFKYNSFPKNAADQAHLISTANKKETRRLKEQGKLGGMPPILTFQSVVDTTVMVGDLIEALYDKLEPRPGISSELILIDVNRNENYEDFFKQESLEILKRLEVEGKTPENYVLTLVTNENPDSAAVVAKSKAPTEPEFGPPESTGLEWPRYVYSQSHVSVPFRPSDPLYGDGSLADNPSPLNLGSMVPRGERGILTVSLDGLLRLRYNVFFDYMASRLVEAVGAGGAGVDGSRETDSQALRTALSE